MNQPPQGPQPLLAGAAGFAAFAGAVGLARFLPVLQRTIPNDLIVQIGNEYGRQLAVESAANLLHDVGHTWQKFGNAMRTWAEWAENADFGAVLVPYGWKGWTGKTAPKGLPSTFLNNGESANGFADGVGGGSHGGRMPLPPIHYGLPFRRKRKRIV